MPAKYHDLEAGLPLAGAVCWSEIGLRSRAWLGCNLRRQNSVPSRSTMPHTRQRYFSDHVPHLQYSPDTTSSMGEGMGASLTAHTQKTTCVSCRGYRHADGMTSTLLGKKCTPLHTRSWSRRASQEASIMRNCRHVKNRKFAAQVRSRDLQAWIGRNEASLPCGGISFPGSP
jgi:hypothetical protein